MIARATIKRFRIPLTAITVFGTGGLVAVTVAIVLYLGFSQAAETTRRYWANQAETLINSMDSGLDAHLRPVREQALWVARDLNDLSVPAALDDYMFGVLAATPQVAGVAVIRPDGATRRWHRAERLAISEDWSQKPWFDDYLNQVETSRGPTWREPIFTDTLSVTTLLHDVPLRDATGQFTGVFAQIVPVHELSHYLVQTDWGASITPFVLYDRNQVLAHPLIVPDPQRISLPELDGFEDPVLRRIWTPDEADPFISRELADTQAAGLFFDEEFYMFLYRDIERYGPTAWTLGAYIVPSQLDGGEVERIRRAALAGLLVLIVGTALAVLAGRGVSKPITSLVAATEAVERGDFDAVRPVRASRIRELDDAREAFEHMVRGLRERRLIRDTLGRFVPEKVAASLLAGGGKLEVQQAEATILFCDIEAFTALTESLGPAGIVNLLNRYFSAMVEILERRGGIVTQFQGDAILATFNVPVADEAHAAQALAAAEEMLECVAQQTFDGQSLAIRIGINTGPVVAGAIGAHERLSYTVHGDAVNLAARLEELNKEFETRLLLSEHTAASIPQPALRCVGETAVRGRSGAIRVYTLAARAGREQSPAR